MQMDANWKDINNNNGMNGYYDNNQFVLSDYDRDFQSGGDSSMSPSPPRLGYIEHFVTKFDTLAGIAIKYGVEVTDIKKMNSLVTDHQMFALKTIQIPLPGRHPPSPCLSNGSITSCPPDNAHHDLLESFQSLGAKTSERKVTPAMTSLQGYYGLKVAFNTSENGSSSKDSPTYPRPLSRDRKSKSLVNVILEEIMQNSQNSDHAPAAETLELSSDKWNDKLIQRRQKSEADFTRIPELLLREDNSNSSILPSRTGKGLALRQKSSNRNTVTFETDYTGSNPVPGDTIQAEYSSGVRKSSSTSCLQDQDNNGSSSIWPSAMRNLKPDFQALSTAGLPKPITGKKNKAALD